MSPEATGLADLFHQAISQAAVQFAWKTLRKPKWESSGLEKDAIAELVDALEPSASPEQHPSEVLPRASRRALELNPLGALMLLTNLEEAEWNESYRRALWWAGRVRTELPPTQRCDLHLFLIAPIGSSESGDWHQRKGRIESDQRFCRKFVWLPTASPRQEEVDALLKRTFLARPWDSKASAPTSLDPLQRLVVDAPDLQLLGANELQAWTVRLESAEAAGAQLAQDLVSVLKGKGE